MNQQPANLNVVPSGFKAIDELIGGYPRGEVTVIASRSSHGRSAYVLSTAANMAKAGYSVMFFTPEMYTQTMMTRLIAGETGINTWNIENGSLTPDQFSRYEAAIQYMKQWQMVFEDTAYLTAELMKETTHRMHLQHNFDVIVVDRLQAMEPSTGTDDEAYISHISQQCKVLAKDRNVAFLAVSQLPRPEGKDQTVRPVLADLDESLVQDASVVQLIHRDEVENKQTEFPNQAEIITAKNRNGGTGITSLYFEKTLTKFMDASVHRVDLSDLG